jgi:hypothetical protein
MAQLPSDSCHVSGDAGFSSLNDDMLSLIQGCIPAALDSAEANPA